VYKGLANDTHENNRDLPEIANWKNDVIKWKVLCINSLNSAIASIAGAGSVVGKPCFVKQIVLLIQQSFGNKSAQGLPCLQSFSKTKIILFLNNCLFYNYFFTKKFYAYIYLKCN
jgi:coenzyme F420-reducing hydrogenase beta subunit